ncbi:hypothetical protein EDC27_2218 [Desulfosoma caldarium]|uniref:Uncharacterized protein n=1 Tax=Desulfosoma caldarium TaxID=610254 RepID=A0A3N1UMH9_9BACT|nr:hypothetical protein EDC27_2218 [Desulfosoma caldarium]
MGRARDWLRQAETTFSGQSTPFAEVFCPELLYLSAGWRESLKSSVLSQGF